MITNEKEQKYKQNIWEIMGCIRIIGYKRMCQKNDTQLSQRGIIVQKGERGKKELLILTKEEGLWTSTNIF